LVGATVTRLGLRGLGTEDLLDIEAVAALPIVSLCWVEVLTEDVVGGFVGVRGARALEHVAKSVVT